MLKVNSKEVKKGDTFLALKGINLDGHDYIEDAINNGASKIICEKGKYDVETIIVDDTRKYLSRYLKEEIDMSNIIMIGITGTNGKTTSSYLTYQLLNSLGTKTAYIGTIGFYIDKKIKDLNNTTPDLYDLYMLFKQCIENNVEVIVMEVSSHSLSMDRLLGIDFDIACYTNLTIDHLDYHKTIEEYKKEKLKLFNKLKGKRYAIINSDTEYSNDFKLNVNNNITYGINGDYKLDILDINSNGSIFKINGEKITLNIPSKYNIYNYLICYIIADLFGYNKKYIIEKTKYLLAPSGRYETIKYETNNIIIDYAHTPDAVLNILNSVNEFNKGKIITILGCGGNRDKSKRKIMGEISTNLSNYVIFTNDNPRFENEIDIMNDIVGELTNTNYEIIYDRYSAIVKGINLLKENDNLLILGKGHEKYQIIGDIKHHFDDKEVVLKYLDML